MTEAERELLSLVDPGVYVRNIGWTPYEWQDFVLSLPPSPILLLATRQAGKSTVIGGLSLAVVRKRPDSLALVIADTQDHSKNLMHKVRVMVGMDKRIGKIDPDATFEIGIRGSRIVGLPGTEASVRSYSAPQVLLIDEAGRVEDGTYFAVRPMRAGVVDGYLVGLTSAAGKRGWFYHAWTEEKAWTKIIVRPAFDMLDDGTFVPAEPEITFRDRMKAQGVHGFYSPRHTKQFLEEELAAYIKNGRGLKYFKQEYFCEFVDMEDSAFGFADIERATATDIPAMFDEDAGILEELPGMPGWIEEAK